MTLPDLGPDDLPWLLRLHAAWALVVVGVLVARVRTGRASGRVAVVVVLAAAAWTVVATRWLGPALPVGALHPVREGFGLHHLQEVTGRELDAGPLQDVLWAPLLVGPRASLRALVTSHLVLAGWNALLFAGLAAHAVRWRPLAVALAVGAAANALALTSATTEVAATVAGFYVLVGAGLWTVAVDPDARAWLRGLAAVGLLGVGAALPFVRPELAVPVAVGGVALVGAVALPRLDDRLAALARAGVRRAPWLPPTLIAAWVGFALWWGEYPPSRLPEPWRWAADGLHPLDPHALTLPIALLGVWPLGLVLLAARGFATSLARPLRTAGLAAVVWMLYAAMRVAAHGPIAMRQARSVAPWELYRYLMGLAPLLLLLALLGAAAASTWRGRWLVVVACLLPATPEATGLLRLAHPAGWPRGFGFERASQLEVRALVARVEAAPACGVVAPVRPWRAGRTWSAPTWAALRPGPRGFEVATSSLGVDVAAATAAAALLPGVPCAVAWRGLDCQAVDGPACLGLEGLVEREAFVAPLREDVHPQHGGALRDPLRLAFLAIPGLPSEP